MSEITFPNADEFLESNYGKAPLGPSSRSCCRVLNSGSCGSGSIVGKRNGRTLVLTNAHVAGTTIGRVVQCQFPFLNNFRASARVIMAGYSDKVMMDWAIAEIDFDVALPEVKLSIAAPTGDHYTMGYPKCEGPYSQRLKTVKFTHSGTVWRWQPISIGGQSGSAVHSFADNLQKGLLTWSWGGDGAGQTTKAIWFQYQQRAAVGFERPEGLIELNNRCDGLENGFFAESSINDLPIWAHLDEPTTPPPTEPNDKEFRDLVLKHAQALVDLAKSKPSAGNGSNPGTTDDGDGGGTFGL